mmetsp:Transcript_71782/g.203147  ORF Transcript_71782/g.203147 Transcript_71782/m.203147 type:complete len:94 (+) Transcript_71782:1319-1600(+)
MVVGATFHEKLEIAKNTVRDLKGALRDYLDAEATAKQDSMLGGINEAAVKNSEKLDHVDAQLEELKQMMSQQSAVAGGGGGGGGKRLGKKPKF